MRQPGPRRGAHPPASLCAWYSPGNATQMAPFAMGLPAFMATMSETAVVAMGTAAISTIGVSCYMIFSASGTPRPADCLMR